MTTLTLTPSYRPTPRQAQAHAAPQRWTLYGGAEGGGKTEWMVEEVIALMCEYAGIEGVIGRYDYNDVMSPTQVYDRFHQTCPPELIADRYRSAPAWTRFVNGSRVTFIGLKDYSASAEYGFAAVDQAEEVPEETIRLLSGRIRQKLPNGRYPHFRLLLTCNPHPGIEWFLAAAREHPDQFIFIPALPSDNPYLPADFFAARRAAYTDDQYRRMIRGQLGCVHRPGAVRVRPQHSRYPTLRHLAQVALLSRYRLGAIGADRLPVAGGVARWRLALRPGV